MQLGLKFFKIICKIAANVLRQSRYLRSMWLEKVQIKKANDASC